ncbi:transmembrane and TPR repeat-containing protein 1-like isoform X2 [Copidosoma floridanum]|uniref:transmembrane and TPR repeat-containing protein 1-like isoform X2 n=1 Tax=Copidosoma floridanum TaxID=29053 RepID=UPI0006C95D26|nr:transmembrane and TPR repeat-containing protein 1-like isoform X2 [Copidosoma floridanum]
MKRRLGGLLGPSSHHQLLHHQQLLPEHHNHHHQLQQRKSSSRASSSSSSSCGSGRRSPGPEGHATESAGWRVYLAVGLVGLGAYLNSLHGDFVHDDVPAILRNRDVLAQSPLGQLLRDDFWGTPMHDPNSHKSYRPLTTLTFRLNYLAAGLRPSWYHATNVALHAAACMLVTRVGLAVASLTPGFAALAGLLFAAHPIHTDAVTGIVGRADVLACIFFLLSFLAYHGQQTAYVWSSVCFGALSMLAKETGVTVLLLNLLYDLCRSWHSIKRSISEAKWNDESRLFARRAATLLVSLGVLLVARLALLHGALPKFSPQDNPAAFHPCFHVRLLTFCYLAALNFWLVLCPASLSHDWQMGSVPLVTSLADTRNLATCLFFGGCLVLTYRAFADFERHPPLVLGWMFLVLPFLPASNLFITVGFVVAERVLYIPSIGWTLLVAYGAQIIWTTMPRRRTLLTTCATLLILLSCCRTVLRNRDWTSRESLLRAGLRALPDNAKMHYNFANFLRDTSQPNRAVLHYQVALWLWPTYASAHNNLGTLTAGEEEAEKHFLAAIQAQPGHVNAHYNLGQLYRKTNRTEECLRMLQKCVSLDPAYTPAYLVLARMASGSTTGALLRHVVRLQPKSPDYLAEYAAWLHQNGKWLAALKYYLKGVALSPVHRASLLGTARILRSRGQWSRVHQLITRWHIMLRIRRGGLIYRGDLYFRSWQLERESRHMTYHHQHNQCLLESECEGGPRPRVASVSVQLEQDGINQSARCNERGCARTRKTDRAAKAGGVSTLLVRNLLETL